jgi:hypothetical protein
LHHQAITAAVVYNIGIFWKSNVRQEAVKPVGGISEAINVFFAVQVFQFGL